jgi:beta-lactamase class A
VYLTQLLLLLPLMLQPTDAPLDGMADRVVEQINEQPKHIAGVYHKALLKQVPEGKLLALYKGFLTKHGRIVGMTLQKRTTPESGIFTLVFQEGVEMRMTLTINKQTPPKIVGLWFGPPMASFKDIESIIKEIEKLPGKVNFQVARLGDKVEVIHALHADTVLAIGSTFKLYLLGTIVEQGRPWDDVVELTDDHKSLPSGVLQAWPDGSPVTVHTLASQMISISDNTATDHLLHYLGRTTVESQLAVMGTADPERSMPMLSTMEMFKIKSDRKLLRKYVKADVAKRRGLLDGRVKKMSGENLAPYADATPVAIETVEWYASAADLCRAMDWFRRRNDKKALDILAINPAVPHMKNEFDYIGYKGGSEPGVLNFTWLVRTKKGEYYALSMGWNNPGDKGVELETYLSLAQSTLRILAGQ